MTSHFTQIKTMKANLLNTTTAERYAGVWVRVH